MIYGLGWWDKRGTLTCIGFFFFIVVILGNRYLKCSIFINHTLDQWRTSCLNQWREGAQSFTSCKGPPGIQILNTRGSEGLLLPTYLPSNTQLFPLFSLFPPVLKFYAFPFFFCLCIEITPYAIYVANVHLIPPTIL